MVMKNRPSSTSWNGRMSVSTWCLYSVSAISMPATKAPSASDRPACSVSQARPERDQQQVEHEQLFALAPRHQREPPAHHLLAADQQHAEQHGRLERGPAERRRHVRAAGVERRDQHQQRHHGQVLEQQHAHHAAAVLAFELEPVGHHLDDDGGARHRHRATPAPSRPATTAPRVAPVNENSPGQQEVPGHRADDRQQHLRQAEPEHQLAHALQLGQVEFEPDHEHQEHDAELGQVTARRPSPWPAPSRSGRSPRPPPGSPASAAAWRGGTPPRPRPRRPGRAGPVRAWRPWKAGLRSLCRRPCARVPWRGPNPRIGRSYWTRHVASCLHNPAFPAFDAARALQLARETFDIEAQALLGLKARQGESFGAAAARCSNAAAASS